MLFTGSRRSDESGGHRGYVAGRYRNGALSDGWTDVSRCAEATFTAFVPACECGWRGTPRPADASGIAACRVEWTNAHQGQRASAAERSPLRPWVSLATVWS